MKNQKTEKEISLDEQKEIDKINLQQSGLKDKEETETVKPAKKSKSKSEVVGEGYTDGNGNFIPADKQGNLSEAYKDRIKGMKPYKRFSDGSLEIG